MLQIWTVNLMVREKKGGALFGFHKKLIEKIGLAKNCEL